MKRTKKTLMAILVGCVGLAISAGAFPPDGGFGGGPQGPGGHHGNQGHFGRPGGRGGGGPHGDRFNKGGGQDVLREVGRLWSNLNLSDEQVEQAAAIVASYREAQKSARKDRVGPREEIEAIIDADEFDEAALRAIIQQEAAQREEAMVLRVKMLRDLRDVLTDEQRELIRDKRAELKQRRESRKQIAKIFGGGRR